ncbi:MAG: hypothetical protein V4574_18915 [Pseudomonadota bacterium]
MPDAFQKYPAYLALQPLRIPAGWRVDWNTLYATSDAEKGEFGGSSLFNATNEGRRFGIDVAFRPEFDPEGRFHLSVIYQPWPRTERGRRRTGVPFALDGDAETVHESDTASYAELVDRLETWIARCTLWVREGN